MMMTTTHILIAAVVLGASIGLNLALSLELWKTKRAQRPRRPVPQSIYRD